MQSRGFAFVEMASEIEAQQAISRFNGYHLNGRKLAVSEVRARPIIMAGEDELTKPEKRRILCGQITMEVIMNRRNHFNQGRSKSQKKRPASRRSRPRRRDKAQQFNTSDDSITGFEYQYLDSLIETSTQIVLVLRQGEQVAGRLVWYDQGCFKITLSDGSTNLLIPKISIKYLHEASPQQMELPVDSKPVGVPMAKIA